MLLVGSENLINLISIPSADHQIRYQINRQVEAICFSRHLHNAHMLHLASTPASIICERIGCQPPSFKEVYMRLKDVDHV
jgi:hypothetical protein